MRRKRTIPLATQVAACGLCHNGVDPSNDCWRAADNESGSLVHALCLAAFFIISESPSRLDYEITEEVNDRSDELTDLLCTNPAHIAHATEG